MQSDNQNMQQTTTSRIGKPSLQREQLTSGELLSSLIHKLCHEIDNPLTAIISVATLIQHISKTSTEEHDIRERLPMYCSSIMDEAWRVSALVEKLLFILSHRQDGTDECVLNDILYAALAKVRDNEKYQELDVRVSVPNISPIIVTDKEQLRYLITEVLLNAHYAALNTTGGTPDSKPQKDLSPIKIAISSSDLETEILVSTPREQPCKLELHQLFDPFVTGYRDNKHPGLGLSAVWSILDRFGGTIQIEEESLATGFTFHTRIKLPNLSSNRIRTTPTTETKNNITKKDTSIRVDKISVLVIEDDQSVSSAIKKILEYGLKNKDNVTYCCTEASQAFELLSSGRKFDAILCDLNLHETSGRHVFETICDRWPNQKPHFAFLTGDSYSGETKMYLKSCEQPFLYKPFEPSELIDLVLQLASTNKRNATLT